MEVKSLIQECRIVKCDKDGENDKKRTLPSRRFVDIHPEDEEAEPVTLKVCRMNGERWSDLARW